MNTSPDIPAPDGGAETKINLRLLLRYMLRHWWWFAISLVVIGAVAAYYLKTVNSTYTTYATVMFNQNEDEDSGSKGMLGSLMASFSMGSNGVNVEDEIIRMQSHSAIKRMVENLDLNKDYYASTSIFRKDLIYFQNSPIEIETPAGMLDTITASTEFKLKIADKGKKLHLKVKQGIYKTVFDKDIPKLPYTVRTPLGSFTITPTADYRPEVDMTFYATLSNPDDYATEIFPFIDVYLAVKKSNAVELKIDDRNNKRARAIANTLIQLYNEGSVADRSAKSQATVNFLNNRLLKLYAELERSGSGIASYKENHNITDPAVEAKYILSVKEATSGALIERETQLGILQMLRDFLASDTNRHSLIPVTSVSGADSESTNSAINNYNTLVLELLKMQSSAKGNNATLRQLENQIEALRANMIESLDRSLSATRIAIGRMSAENGNVNSRISAIPRIEQELTNLMRDNEIKNRIYAYLLQKREEAEVKLARTLATAKIIDPAWTDMESKRPGKILIFAAAMLLAVLIPGFVLSTIFRHKFVTTDKDALKAQEKELKQEIG